MTQSIPKPRIEYIDIAKGLLIICLLFGHERVYGPMDGVDDKFMFIMAYPCVIYSAFFMQAFFIITGFCSSFKVDFKMFLWKNIKTLLLPSILLFMFSEYYKLCIFEHTLSTLPFSKLALWITTGAPWFIMAMFLGKLLYWPICRLQKKWQIVILAVLYLIGLLAHKYSSYPNYLWYQHTLLLTPYLLVGNQLKVNRLLEGDIFLKYAAGFFVVSISVQVLLSKCGGYIIPSQDYSICVTLLNFPIHIVNSVSGTALTLWVSKRIAHSGFLSTLGKGTLLIYLWNGIVYRSIIRLLMPFYNAESFFACTIFHVVCLVAMYVAFYYIVRIVYEHKSINWIVGKW